MPIYEYACEKCGHEFEREQRITDAPIKTCPECRSRKVKKLISRTSFVLKGGGWYADAYSSTKKDDKAAAKSDGESSPASSTASDSTSSSDAKKPSKSESKPSKNESKPSKGESKSKNAA